MLSGIVDTLLQEGIPEYTILILLYLPIVATFVAGARYIIGWKSLGMYAPLLLSFALLDLSHQNGEFHTIKGLKYGLTLIIFSATLAFIMHQILKKVRIHYLSKISIIVSTISFTILGLLYFGSVWERYGFRSVDAMPILVIVLIVDVFVRFSIRKGAKKSLMLLTLTISLAVFFYVLLSLDIFKKYVFAYPEISLAALPISFLIGKFEGLRMTEYVRFWELLKDEDALDDTQDTEE